MAAAKVYLDEDVHSFIARALRHRGWQAVTTAEAGNSGASDADQLRFSAGNGFLLLTYNVQDFPRLHYESAAQGESHSGIAVGMQDDPRRNLRGLLRILASFDAEQLSGQLLYLSNWA